MTERKQTTVELVTDIPWDYPLSETGDYSHYRDMALVCVKHGQGRFIDGVNHLGPPDGGLLYRSVSLDGKPLVQMRDTEHPGAYGYGKLAPGAGLEHLDCSEMRQIDEAFQCGKPYGGFEDAFEKLKPLFSLMNDGYYILADTLMCPTDGGNKIFWDVDSTPRECPAFRRDIDFFDCAAGQHPHYLYPSKWPSCFSKKAPQRFDSGYFTEEEKPRVVAYAVSSTLALLLDGHYKAIDHMEYYELVPCLLIIPHMKDREDYGPVERREFEPATGPGAPVEKRWMLYPHAAMHYSEVLSFLADNAAKLIRYDAELYDAIYPPAK